MDKNRLNSAKVNPSTLAAWLPLIVEALNGLKLKVKTDSNAVYVSLGIDEQLAVTPTSESTGSYEKQIRDGNEVTVEDSGEYKDLKELIKLVTEVKKTNSSKESPVVDGGDRRLLKAGRNLQSSIDTQALNSNRLSPVPNRPNRNRQPVEQKTRSQRLYASRMQSLRASTPNLGDDLVTSLSTEAGEIQEVNAVLFNSPGVDGEPVLNIAFYDTEANVFVLQGMSEGSTSATFETVKELIDFAFGNSSSPISPILDTQVTDDYDDDFDMNMDEEGVMF